NEVRYGGYSIRPVYNDYEGKRSLESNAIHTGKEHKYERDFYKLEKTQRNLNHRLEIKKEFPKTKENQSFTYY
ncbi:MAG: hypothetical protein HUK08_03090, partial [Bacteroidaceae bacterium]|nr:hypothetical protein [Bacteroidaceae bacterium]